MISLNKKSISPDAFQKVLLTELFSRISLLAHTTTSSTLAGSLVVNAGVEVQAEEIFRMMVQGIRQGPLENNKNGNMDMSLLEDIKKTIREEKMQCNFVADDQATQLIQNLTAKFSFDTNQLFIWSNKDVSEIYNYEEDPSSWEPLMQNLLTKFDDQLFLAVTDEEFFPWDVLNCSKDSFIKLLREQRYFEYFIFDFSFACVLFDTHDNSLILFESDSD